MSRTRLTPSQDSPHLSRPKIMYEPTTDRVDELLSLYFDEGLNPAEAAELEGLLIESEDARQRCIETAQVHADLHAYYNAPKDGPSVAPALPLTLTGMGLPANN